MPTMVSVTVARRAGHGELRAQRQETPSPGRVAGQHQLAGPGPPSGRTAGSRRRPGRPARPARPASSAAWIHLGPVRPVNFGATLTSRERPRRRGHLRQPRGRGQVGRRWPGPGPPPRSRARRAGPRTRGRTGRWSPRRARGPARQAPVDTSSTRPITIVCTRRRVTPPRTRRGRPGPASWPHLRPCQPGHAGGRGRPGPRLIRPSTMCTVRLA